MTELSLGTYRHYKGNEYEVLAVGTHTETNEQLVIYKSLTDEKIWVRPLAMFLENIEIEGEAQPRFERIN